MYTTDKEKQPKEAERVTHRKSLFNMNRGDKMDKPNVFTRCSFCGSSFSTSNHSFKLTPKPALNGKIKRLLARHSTDPSSLGKFQKKLVKDYIQGKNNVVIFCHICKKTTKLAGQNRSDRQQQKLHQERRTVHIEESADGVKGSKRKEKKRERQKLQRKKKAGVTEEDTNAGLTLPVGLPASSSLNNERCSLTVKEPVYEGKKSGKDEILTKKGEHNSDVMLSNEVPHRSIKSSNIHKKEVVTKTGNVSQINSTSLPITGQQKLSNRKNKSKKMSQKLSNILKQEQKNKTEGTLADFLSSL